MRFFLPSLSDLKCKCHESLSQRLPSVVREEKQALTKGGGVHHPCSSGPPCEGARVTETSCLTYKQIELNGVNPILRD